MQNKFKKNGVEVSALGIKEIAGNTVEERLLNHNINANNAKITKIGNGTLNALTVDPSALDPTINTTGQNLTIASRSGSVIIQLG